MSKVNNAQDKPITKMYLRENKKTQNGVISLKL